MTTNSFSKDHFVSTGDVYVFKGYSGRLFGHKVMDYAWLSVDGVETKVFALQSGSVAENKWKAGSEADTVFMSKKQVVDYGFEYTWIPDVLPRFKDGDFLSDQDGIVYFYENVEKVWKLAKNNYDLGAQWSSLKNREDRDGRTFKVYKTAADKPFRNVVAGLS